MTEQEFTPEWFEEAGAICEAATPGPWEIVGGCIEAAGGAFPIASLMSQFTPGDGQSDEDLERYEDRNAAFIATFDPPTVAKLLEMASELDKTSKWAAGRFQLQLDAEQRAEQAQKLSGLATDDLRRLHARLDEEKQRAEQAEAELERERQAHKETLGIVRHYEETVTLPTSRPWALREGGIGKEVEPVKIKELVEAKEQAEARVRDLEDENRKLARSQRHAEEQLSYICEHYPADSLRDEITELRKKLAKSEHIEQYYIPKPDALSDER